VKEYERIDNDSVAPGIPKCISFRYYIDIDEWPELSYIGEYKSKPKPNEYYVNRRNGKLYSPEDKVLAIGLEEDHNRRHYEYFVPGYEPEKGKPPTRDEIKGMIWDYERMQSYERGYWYVLVVNVEMLVMGEVVLRDALYGIESDDKETLENTPVELARELWLRRDKVILKLENQVNCLSVPTYTSEVEAC
jgi:hypothetical protein